MISYISRLGVFCERVIIKDTPEITCSGHEMTVHCTQGFSATVQSRYLASQKKGSSLETCSVIGTIYCWVGSV